MIVHGDVVELRGWLVVLLGPRLASVHRNRNPAIVAVDQALRVGGIDPQAVMIAVRRRQQLEGLAAIVGAERAGVQHIHGVHLFGIGEHVTEIPCTLAVAIIVVHARPRVARIVGAKQPAFLGLDERIHAIGVRSRNRNSDASQVAFWQAIALQVLPRQAAIDRFVQAAARSAAVEIPRLAAYLPQRRVHHTGIPGIEDNINRAGVVVLVQNFLPGVAAIGGAEDTAL